MPRRSLVIRLDHDLPHRASPISAEALSAVFGGCVPLGQTCSPSAAACCYGACQLYKPYPNWPGVWICDVLANSGE